MGRLMGSYESEDEFDRPDLNKCPDCKTYFAGENCPLCGKPCPEEYRAGNRKAVKVKKRKNTSGRVTFINWYHRWWFIAIMMVVMPLVGIILLATAPHRTWKKITFALVCLLIWALPFVSALLIGLNREPVVNAHGLTFEEYKSECKEFSPREYFRTAGDYEGQYVKLTLTVESDITDEYSSPYGHYYICSGPDGGDYRIFVRDCQIEDMRINLMKGDTFVVYGEAAAIETVGQYTYPALYMAFAELLAE